MVKVICILLFLVICLQTNAKDVTVKGFINDKETNLPMPFVTVFIEGTNNGAITSSSGYFSLKVPKDEMNRNLVIITSKYGTSYLPLKTCYDNQLFAYYNGRWIAYPKDSILSASVKLKTEIINKVKDSGCYYVIEKPGIMIGEETEIPNEKSFLQGIRIKVINKKPKQVKYRLYMYSINPKYDSLQTPIMAKDILFSLSSDTNTQTVDLKKYHIFLPKKKFFIGLEVINLDSSYEPIAFGTSCASAKASTFMTRMPFTESELKKGWNTPPEKRTLNLSLIVAREVKQ